LNQIYQRWDYQHYSNWWTTLTASQKATWLSNASRYHITGYNLWLRTYLKSLSDMMVRYHLDERAGAIANDSSRNSRHATIIGATPTPGLIDYCLSFDGLNDYLEIPLAAFPDGNATFMWFAKAPFSTLAVGKIRMVSTLHSSGLNYEFRTGSYNPIRWFVPNGTSYWDCDFGNPVDDEWTHFAVTHSYDGANTTARTFLHGVYVDTAIVAGKAPVPDSKFRLANWRYDYFPGQIDEFIVFNRALPDDLIKQYSERRYP